MTKVINFKEIAMFSEINAKTTEEVLDAFKATTWQDVAMNIHRAIIRHQREIYEVFKASLREEAADGIIPPKNGGSLKAGGEHGAGIEQGPCGLRCGSKMNIRKGVREQIFVACPHIVDGNQCEKRKRECAYTLY